MVSLCGAALRAEALPLDGGCSLALPAPQRLRDVPVVEGVG